MHSNITNGTEWFPIYTEMLPSGTEWLSEICRIVTEYNKVAMIYTKMVPNAT